MCPPPEYDFFPPEVIELQLEAMKHPELVEILANRDDKSTLGGLKEVATYCEVVVDGRYTQPELYKLASVLVNKLKAKRAPIVILPGSKL